MEKKLWRRRIDEVGTSPYGSWKPIEGMQELFGNGNELRFAIRLALEEGPPHRAQANGIVIKALLKGLLEISKRIRVPVGPWANYQIMS